MDPGIEVALEFGDRSIDLLAEDDAKELIEHRLAEPLDDAVRFADSWSWCANGRYLEPKDDQEMGQQVGLGGALVGAGRL